MEGTTNVQSIVVVSEAMIGMLLLKTASKVAGRAGVCVRIVHGGVRIVHGVLGCGGSNVSVGGGGRARLRMACVYRNVGVYRNVYRNV